MNKINIQKWKRFHLYDSHMFYIDMGNKFDKSKMDTTQNDINFVGRTGVNNGISATCGIYKNVKPYPPGLLTVALGGSIGSCFIQQKPFYTSQNVIVLIPKDNITNNAKQFIASIIQKESSLHYQAFVKELNAHIKTDFSIPLPVNNKNEPNWEYMESYMKNIMQESKQSIEKLSKIKVIKSPIDISEWKEFKVGDLFDIHPTKHYNDKNGKALPNRDLFNENGKNPVIVNSAYNNGVGGYTNKPCNEKGGIITFSDTTTSDAIFYQENDFVGYSHVQGMYPIKYQNKWTKYSMKFFEVIFHTKADSLGYNFINKFTRDLASRIIVKLPTKMNKYYEDEPDWEYMENYMKKIFQKAESNLSLLTINIK